MTLIIEDFKYLKRKQPNYKFTNRQAGGGVGDSSTLQDWRCEAGHPRCELEPERLLAELAGAHLTRMGEVLLEHGGHLAGKWWIHHQGRNFKIQP